MKTGMELMLFGYIGQSITVRCGGDTYIGLPTEVGNNVLTLMLDGHLCYLPVTGVTSFFPTVGA